MGYPRRAWRFCFGPPGRYNVYDENGRFDYIASRTMLDRDLIPGAIGVAVAVYGALALLVLIVWLVFG